MGRRVRERLPVAVGLLLVGVAVAWTAWAYRLDPAERSDELGLPGFVLGLVGVLIPLMAGLRRGRRLTDHRSVDAVATLLAQGVYGQWRKAADERRLVTPAPISIRWSLSKLDVAGPVAAARRTLTCIARRMGTERDLAWWHIPRWAPATPRILTTALVVGLLGLTIGLASSLQDGLVFGLIGALTSGFTARHGQDEPARLTMANWRAAISRKILGRVFVYGLQGGLSLASLFGLMFWLMDEFASAIRYGFAGALAGGVLLGFAFGLVFGLVFQLLDVLVEVSTADGSPAGPSEVWSKDRMGGIVDGLVFGLVFGSTVGVVFGLVFGVFGLILGLTVVFASYQTWPTTLAWLQLRHSGQVSPAGLMRFLEDARERDVLRTVGAVYQFRHAMLQDQLAAHTTSDSVASAAALRTS